MLVLDWPVVGIGLLAALLGTGVILGVHRNASDLPSRVGRSFLGRHLKLSPTAARRVAYLAGACFALVGLGLVANQAVTSATAREMKATCEVYDLLYHDARAGTYHDPVFPGGFGNWWEIDTSCGALRTNSLQPGVAIGQSYRFDYYLSRNLFWQANTAQLLAHSTPAAR